MNALHPNQRKLLDFLKQSSLNGHTLREVASEIGIPEHPQLVLHHIHQLEKKGYLRRDPSDPQSYIILKDPIDEVAYVPLYGLAQCGPNDFLNQERLIERIPLPTERIKITPDSFLVKAQGDSMEPYIQHGDLVHCWKHPKIEVEKLMVIVDGDTPRIKKIFSSKTGYILISQNPACPAIEVSEENLTPVGLVKNVISIKST